MQRFQSATRKVIETLRGLSSDNPSDELLSAISALEEIDAHQCSVSEQLYKNAQDFRVWSANKAKQGDTQNALIYHTICLTMEHIHRYLSGEVETL